MTEVLITATEKEIAIPKVVFKPFSQLPNVNIGVTVSLYKNRKANEKKSSLWCNFKKELILNNTSFGFIETPVKIENYDTLTCCLISNSVSENPVPFEGVLHFEFGF